MRRPDRRRRRRRVRARVRARRAAARRRARRGARGPSCSRSRASTRASRRSRTARSRSLPGSICGAELKGYTEAIRSIHISERGRFGAARIEAGEENVPALGYTVENQTLGRVLWERLQRARALDGAGAGQGRGARAASPTAPSSRSSTAAAPRACARSSSSRPTARARPCAPRSASRRPSTTTGSAPSSSTAAPKRRSTAAHSSASRSAGRSRCCRSRAAGVPSSGRCPRATPSASRRCPSTLSERSCRRHSASASGASRASASATSIRSRASRAAPIHGERAVLIGDAALRLHPSRGRASISRCATSRRWPRSLPTALRAAHAAGACAADVGAAELLERYAAWRTADRQRVSSFTHGLIQLFGESAPGLGLGRGLGLMAFDLAARREGAARAPDDGQGGPAAAPGARPAPRLKVTQMASTPTVLVAGAGVVGLATAALLATGRCADRLRVLVLDARPLPALARRGDGRARLCAVARVAAAARARRRVAAQSRRRAPRRIGACASGKGPTPTRRARSISTAPTSASPTSAISSRTRCCAPFLPMRSPPRRKRSSSSARRSSPSKREAGEVVVALGEGGSMRAAALLAADGSDSAVRRLLGLPVAGHRYEQTAVVTHVTSRGEHQETAWQRFLPGGPLALLPLADGRSSIVWSLPTAEAERLLAASDSGVSRRARGGERRRHRRAHGVLEARRLSAAGVARAALHGAARRAARRRCAYGAPARRSRHELGTS